MRIKDYIKSNEGLRLKPYHCSANKLTIGYGRNLDDVGIFQDEADQMLGNDIRRSEKDLESIFTEYFLYHLEVDVIIVLIDMMFNLGKTRFSTFIKLIQAIKDGDYKEASKQILDSNYAKQVPNRASRNAKMMLDCWEE